MLRKLLLTVFVATFPIVSTATSQTRQVVVVDRAATLTVPFDALAKRLPNLECRQRSAGSRFLMHSDVDLNQPVDVLALADIQLFEQPSSPAQTARFPWWVTFAGNEIGIAYTQKSHGADIINAANWPEVLQRGDVQTAYADPELDPEGYNTVLAWTLAESNYHQPGLAAKLRAAIPKKNIRPDSTQLLAMLNAGEIDFAWQYRSVAEQHHLQFLRLPREINLGDPALAATYATACLDLHRSGANGQKQVQQHCGRPILYAVSIASDAAHPEAAVEFVKALLGEGGREVLNAASQEPLAAVIGGNAGAVPEWLKAIAK